MRSVYCRALRAADIDKEVQLCGWVDTRRDHGGVILSTCATATVLYRWYLTQTRIAVLNWPIAFARNSSYRCAARCARTPNTVNKNMGTGEIEVYGLELTILNTAETPPFPLDASNVGEDVRLRYRYIDLRRNQMQNNLRFRSKVTNLMRNYLDANGFLDIETLF